MSPGGRLPLLLVAVTALAMTPLACTGLGEGLTYYRTPSELRPAGGEHVRLGGLVVPGTAHPDGRELHFSLTDGTKTIDVVHTGYRPPVFREGQGVVAEGVLGADGRFRSDRLMVKHSEEYRAADGSR
ncbi:cytochrome c maturation protein CcmE [Sinosporangium siamense]|uniref:Cytochrome c-type biogenesis protein CcmE n=1 Tax=Sinosporangium siamense TaxID=1367973 RepID=A0A919V8R8_9ACTN|nr:cytochrome c maturation protein CcmE [Sinosporangium siamense]GII94531.1 cytochrome c-type biogenesis protein CcmE [Sinosporangium siamense]